MISLLSLLAVVPVAVPPPPLGQAARRSGPIELDGRLDEPAWAAAPPLDGFRQMGPDEGAKATVKTTARVLWDDEALYFGIDCEDPQPITEVLSRRDRWVEGDRIDVDLETVLDGRTAYHFSVYAAGQQLDGIHYNDTWMTTDWDAVWSSAVARTPRGWSVEMRIPLRALRIPEHPQAFGLQVARILTRRNEESHWRWAPNGTPGYVSTQMGRLEGVEALRPVRALELRPFVAMRADRSVPALSDLSAPANLGLCSSVGLTHVGLGKTCFGLDGKWALSSDLSLVGAVNPDFGEVEADQRLLNLSTFETFFPEKRPFFLEGMETFQQPYRMGFGFGPYAGDAYQVFYSRRIGRSPTSINNTLPSGFGALYEPGSRPVLDALKLTGTAAGANIGVISALEPAVDAQVVDPSGRVVSQRVDQPRHSAMARARIQLGEVGLLGFTGTAVDPLFARAQAPLTGGTPDPASTYWARHTHTGGADLALFDSSHTYSLNGQVVGSRVDGGLPSTLRDGTVLGPGAQGLAASGRFSKDGDGLVALAAVDYLSPQLWLNDLGYMRRGNELRTIGMIGWADNHRGAHFQSLQLNLGALDAHNAAAEVRLFRGAFLEASGQTSNYFPFDVGFFATQDVYDDRELGDGTPFARPGGPGVFAFVGTDSRKDLSFTLNLNWDRSLNGPLREGSLSLGARLRPLPQLEIHLSLDGTDTINDIRNIREAGPLASQGDPTASLDRATATQQARQYLFASQNSRSLSSTLRATYAFTPYLTLQTYAQLFGAGVSYGDPLKATVGPGRAPIELAALTPAQAADQPPNADDRQGGLNLNVILRWEWRLGSTLYLVYSHATSNDFTPSTRGLDLQRELSAFSAAGASHGDTLLVKMDLLKAL